MTRTTIYVLYDPSGGQTIPFIRSSGDPRSRRDMLMNIHINGLRAACRGVSLRGWLADAPEVEIN